MEDVKKVKDWLAPGSGYGYGYGSGYGSGDGSGYGSGYGYGSSYGSSYGSGYGFKEFKGQHVFYIDGIPTLINRIRNNYAIGAIVQQDMTIKKCYVAKQENYFAHGATLKDAVRDVQEKAYEGMGVDEKIDELFEIINIDNKYTAHFWYNWHGRLTGSCQFGRDSFVKQHDIDIEKDTFTLAEFIELTEHDYGGKVIKQIKERI